MRCTALESNGPVCPRVSVIIPSYNHGRFLRQRIDSILNQTYPDFEVIILDDASTDDSRDVLKSYRSHPKIRMVLNEKNSGCVFRQWNAGMALARGAYVWIAESDDYAERTFLEELTAVLDQHASVGLVKCRSTTVDEDGRLAGSVEYPASRDWSHDFILPGCEDCHLQLVHGNSICNASAVLFRRQLFLDAGGADESYRMCADWLQWAKMMLRSDFAYVAKPLNYYRCHSNTVRQKCLGNVIQDLEDLRVCAYLLGHLPAGREVARQTGDRFARRWLDHSLSRTRMRHSLTYDWQMLRVLRQTDPWYIRHILKHFLRRVLRQLIPSGRHSARASAPNGA